MLGMVEYFVIIDIVDQITSKISVAVGNIFRYNIVVMFNSTCVVFTAFELDYDSDHI